MKDLKKRQYRDSQAHITEQNAASGPQLGLLLSF